MPRSIENFQATHEWRRRQNRFFKRQAYMQAQLAAGHSLSSIVQSIKVKTLTP